MIARASKAIALIVSFGLLPFFTQNSLAEGNWITENEMKRLSADARQTGEILKSLNCRFEKVENPGRKDVLFQPEFISGNGLTGWGWTFEANAPNPGTAAQAKQHGFKLASEDYFEVTGVTWVRCRVWQR